MPPKSRNNVPISPALHKRLIDLGWTPPKAKTGKKHDA
jgi:hypothetical protein